MQMNVQSNLGSRTIRFTNKFSEHKASRMTYYVSSYEHTSHQHRGVIVEEISSEEEEGREDVPTSLIREICAKWGEVQSFVE